MNFLKKLFGRGKAQESTQEKPETPSANTTETAPAVPKTEIKQETAAPKAETAPKPTPKKTAPAAPAETPKAVKTEQAKPAKQEEKPVKAAEKPAKVAEKPATSEGAPAKAAEKPAKSEEAPTKAAEKPAKTAEKAPKSEDAPVKTEKAPAKAAEKPVKSEEAPAKAEEKPTKTMTRAPKAAKPVEKAEEAAEVVTEQAPSEPTAEAPAVEEQATPNVLLGKFFIKFAKNNELMFNLKASNGEIIATSDMYSSMEKCKKGIASVQLNAPIANLEDHTTDGALEEVVNPKFEMYVDKGGAFRFRLRARNGEIIAKSQGYASKSNCKNGIESVRKNAMTDVIVVEENPNSENA